MAALAEGRASRNTSLNRETKAAGGEAIEQSVRRPVVCAHLEKAGQALDWHGALSIDCIMPDDGGALRDAT